MLATGSRGAWVFRAKQWRKPSLQECIAEFGAADGPRLFEGGYWPIEKARAGRQPSAVQLGAKHAPKPVDAGAPVPKPVKESAVDPRIAKIRELQAERERLSKAVAAKEQVERLTAEIKQLEAEVEKRQRRAAGKGIRMADDGFRAAGRGPTHPAA